MTYHSEFNKGQSITVLFKDKTPPLNTKYVEKKSKGIETLDGFINGKFIRQIVITRK